MTTRLQRVRAVTLEDKLAYWISRSINVLFRCGPGISVAVGVTAAFAKAGLNWRAYSALINDFERPLGDESVDAVFIDGLDRLPKKFRRAVLNTLGKQPSQKIVWATVTVFDEDDFDLEAMDRLNVDGFDVVVEAPCQP